MQFGVGVGLPKSDNAEITMEQARAPRVDVAMRLPIKLREMKLYKKNDLGNGRPRARARAIFYYPISRADLIVSGNQFQRN